MKSKKFSLSRVDVKSKLWVLSNSQNKQICMKSLEGALIIAGIYYNIDKATQARIIRDMSHKHDRVDIEL